MKAGGPGQGQAEAEIGPVGHVKIKTLPKKKISIVIADVKGVPFLLRVDVQFQSRVGGK
jgi:hypothetical protein